MNRSVACLTIEGVGWLGWCVCRKLWWSGCGAAAWRKDEGGSSAGAAARRGDRRLNCFFFFQAEDGIRDLTVTGVQTCALPIYVYIRDTPSATQRTGRRSFEAATVSTPARRLRRRCRVSLSRARRRAHHRGWRSEERRVGKECRSRWSPYH